ncbi:4-hydroxy-tetrahydrodipicolinate reductase [Buchnera aphidicola]|uniref:4-hydroxy-tetrahydrodipicolinate reductase n=1 Tax=Buchnera aphidicola subsp. Cinara cedri (strain Cc) TaxID=372461 RepID=DAPB_BUCCC|nr:4-hydroxy-tetrahydrodipicolinate reductase [Buchnera aphidicola]Q057Y0.1 RecName: Full=4-hydroxy-tetrahydrodipicolinate reductase; Short=HTPA reductase [Buchnera aphidicola BCc]ABJ90569.1 dihydrodipicolinate reductase [Buchnera aphidicola BCc]
MKNKTKIIISGALGRMGKILIKETKKNKLIKLVYALINNNIDIKNHNQFYKVKEKKKFITLNNLKKKKKILKFDTIIDFSSPKYSIKIIKYCLKNNKKIVLGTTGFNTEQIKIINNASKKIPIIYSPNFSIGINIIYKILKNISKILGKNSDIEIIESHHRNKIDAPSGTALQLGKIISKSMKWNFKKSAIFSRYGNIGIRKKKRIGFSTIREGNTIGEHTVLFSNKYEKISIFHKAIHRSVFAKGALKAAIWISRKKNGLYNMSDMLKKIKI